jgi:branched-chain amino acid transport system permease protein
MTSAGTRVNAEFAATGVILLIVALLPLAVSNDYWLGVLVVSMYFAMCASAWNLLAGYAGQFSLAPATFALIGAYTTGLLAFHFGASPWLGIPAAIVVSSLIGLILGRIVLRLSGPYLALTTLAFAEIMRTVIGNSINITRGDLGLEVPGILNSRLGWYFLFLAVLALVQLGFYGLLRARAGLYLQAIRDDEIGAARRGVEVVFWKTIAFALSSGVCGLAGALYGHFAHFVSPELGLIAQTGLIITMVVIGGMGTLAGPLIGAFLVYASSELLRDAGGWQLVVFAMLVILFARFFSAGLWGFVRRLALPGHRRAVAAAGGSAGEA